MAAPRAMVEPPASLQWTHELATQDDAFLREALALLDDDDEPPAPQPTKRPRPETTTTTTVARRRQEIAHLRDQVAALEAAREEIRKRHRRSDASVQRAAWVLDRAMFWEVVATRERELRDQTALENQRLKAALQEMQRQREGLEALLRRPKDEPRPSLRRPTEVRLGPTRSPASRFAELMGSLQQQYLETPSALASVCTVPSYHPLRSCLDTQITPRKTLQLVEQVVFPFSYNDTMPEVWETLSGIADAKPGINFSCVDMREDSFRLELMIDVQHQRTRAEFHLTTVAKRIIEPTRTVIVWTGVAIPAGVGGVRMDGISIRQRGWSVVEPVGSLEIASGSTPAATRLRMFIEDHVHVDESVKKKSAKIGNLLQYLLGVYALEGGARRQHTENRLFDRAMRARK